MYYTLDARRPALAAVHPAEPTHHTIFGVPADSFLRVALPIGAGLLGVAGLVYAATGRSQIATFLTLGSATISATIAAAEAIRGEQIREQARSR